MAPDDVVLRVKRWLELYDEVPKSSDKLHAFTSSDETIILYGYDIRKLIDVADAARNVVRAEDEGAYFVNIDHLREVLKSLTTV